MPQNSLILGDWWAVCDICGFKHKASQMRKNWKGQYVCGKDFETRHPQDLIRPREENPTTAWTRDEPAVRYTTELPAQFLADVTTGPVPLTVHFTDYSTNNPTTWSWDFGDGTTSTSQNPTKIYSSQGPYTVTLDTDQNSLQTKTAYVYPYYTTILPEYTWTVKSLGNSTISSDGLTWTGTISGANNPLGVRTGTAITGKKYCEFIMTSNPGGQSSWAFGITRRTDSADITVFYNTGNVMMFSGGTLCGLAAQGVYTDGASLVSTNIAYHFVTGDIIGVAVNHDTGEIWFSKNGTWLNGGNPSTGANANTTFTPGTWYFAGSVYPCSSVSGTYVYTVYPLFQTYSPPTGFSVYQS